MNSTYSAAEGLSDFVNTLAEQYGGWAIPQTLWQNIQAFIESINWSETWLICIIIYHILTFFLSYFTRKIWQAQFFILFTNLILIFLAETINTVASDHWKEFATQNYFDKQGIFISLLLSAPQIAIAFIILCQNLYYASTLLITVKRKQLLSQKTNKKKSKQE